MPYYDKKAPTVLVFKASDLIVPERRKCVDPMYPARKNMDPLYHDDLDIMMFEYQRDKRFYEMELDVYRKNKDMLSKSDNKEYQEYLSLISSTLEDQLSLIKKRI